MPSIVTNSTRVREPTHSMPTEWLNSRIVAFMFAETAGHNWWICSYTADGKFIATSHDGGLWTPRATRIDYARRVAHHLNKKAAYGGAWITGWVFPTTFLMIWKDPDGDIQMMNDCQKPWHIIREWREEVWETSAHQMYSAWYEIEEAKELAGGQTRKLAQGEQVSDVHQRVARSGYEISVDPVLDAFD